MKNIYNDQNPPASAPEAPQGQPAPQGVPGQQPYFVQQPYPYFMQPPYQQAYYAPQPPAGYVQGVPVPQPQLQLTPEQVAALLQQYAVPLQYVQPQPQQTEQPQADDPGTRILYQSADFDTPNNERQAFDDDFELSYAPVKKEAEEGYSLKSTDTENQGMTVEDEFTIEEETVTLPQRESLKKKSTMQVEEMEMSTFELNSILLRQSKGQTREFPKEKRPVREAPLEFSGSFSIEDAVDEEISDISSDSQEKKEKRSLPVSEILRRCILALSLTAIIIASAMLLNEYRLSKENDELEQGISDLIIEEATQPASTNKNDKNKNDKDKTTDKPPEDASTTVPLTPEQQWAQLQAEYPSLIFPVGIQLKYAKLYATNQDFVGYLEAEGSKLSLPIVQTENDSDYLEKNFYKKSTKYGCPFVTHLNNIVELDQNTIIFGHHMNNGTVFGALDDYKSIEGFRAAPLITFNTLYKDYSWKIIAAFITNAYEEDDNGYVFKYYFTSLSTEDRFAAYLNELSQRSLYDTGVDVLPTDKLLTLSTCSHEFEDARFVVVARLVRPGESEEVDVTLASANPSPRYPQAFYDKNKKENPYKTAYRWEVG